eukprot:jgi/Bigna1/139503/aug1.50_g14211
MLWFPSLCTLQLVYVFLAMAQRVHGVGTCGSHVIVQGNTYSTPDPYGTEISCTFTLTGISGIKFDRFWTDTGYDYLHVQKLGDGGFNESFSGSEVPASIGQHGDYRFQWYSDNAVTFSGWSFTVLPSPSSTWSPTWQNEYCDVHLFRCSSSILHPFAHKSEQDLQQNEKEGLRELCTALGGPSALGQRWAGLYNATLYTPPCQWNGLKCEHRPTNSGETSPHIVGIVLNKMELTGTIPNSLPRLFTFLQRLDLSDNLISGTIPAAFICDPNNPNGTSENLLYFSVSSNQLSGILPSDECLANRSSQAQLQYFDGSNNLLSGTIPAAFICDPKTLDAVSNNMLYFSISSNKLSGTLPSNKCLANRSSQAQLQYFLGSNNLLSGTIPAAFICDPNDPDGASKYMQQFSVSSNQLSGTLPSNKCLASRSSQARLQYFYGYNNLLSGTIPAGFICDPNDPNGASKNMQVLYIDSNKLSGTLPSDDCLASRSSQVGLQYFYGQNNSVSGTIPAGFICDPNNPNGASKNIMEFSVSSNQLSGTLPSDECLTSRSSQAQLDVFVGSNNLLSGTIPAAFICDPKNPDGASKNLLYFSISSNKLSGTLPSNKCLANRSSQARLQYFYGYDNLLSGTIPAGFICDPNDPNGAIRNIQAFSVSSNRLSGTLPSNRCVASRHNSSRLSPLIEFEASHNIISGQVPSSLFDLGSETEHGTLLLAGCRLSGAIPPELQQVTATKLKVVDLSQNDLSGSIPDLVLTFPNLTVLSLSSNRNLKGRLDSFPMERLQYLLIDGTHLSGDLGALGSMTTPRKIHLAGNQLSGTIPEALFLHSSLEELVLSHNRVSGSLPNTIGSARGLRKLLLDTNRIDGQLPDTLADVLPLLREIRLNLNEISCDLPIGLQQAGAFDSRNGTGGSESTPATQIVQGNMFGCRGIEALSKVDAYGKAYQCGYSAYLVPFIVSVVIVALIAGLGACYVCRGESSNWKISWNWVRGREQGLLPRASRGVFFLSGSMVGIGLLAIAAGAPTYETASSHFECQYANKISLAFVEKSPESASHTHYPVEWVTTTLLALSIGGMAWVITKSRPSRLNRKENVALRFIGIGLPTSPSGPYASETKQSLSAIGQSQYQKLESNGSSNGERTSASWQRYRTAFLVTRTVLVLAALLMLIMSTSIAQVYVDVSSRISYSVKNLMLYAITAIHILLSLTIFEFCTNVIVGDVSELMSGRREASASFSVDLWWNTALNSLSNIFAPAISGAFAYDSCLRPLLIPLQSAPKVHVTTNICTYGTYGFTDEGNRYLIDCYDYVTLSTGNYQPSFNLRSDYCTSALVRVFAPFFTTLVLEMLLGPIFQTCASFVFSRPNAVLLFVFDANSFALWPDIARNAGPRKLARATQEVVKWAYCSQITLVGITLTMGIAAPIVAMAVSFASVILALYYANLMSILGAVVNEREEEMVRAGEAQVIVRMVKVFSSTFHRLFLAYRIHLAVRKGILFGLVQWEERGGNFSEGREGCVHSLLVRLFASQSLKQSFH